MIVTCMLLQYLYGLSDPRLEEVIADRRSFQFFLGLVSADAIPIEHGFKKDSRASSSLFSPTHPLIPAPQRVLLKITLHLSPGPEPETYPGRQAWSQRQD